MNAATAITATTDTAAQLAEVLAMPLDKFDAIPQDHSAEDLDLLGFIYDEDGIRRRYYGSDCGRYILSISSQPMNSSYVDCLGAGWRSIRRRKPYMTLTEAGKSW